MTCFSLRGLSYGGEDTGGRGYGGEATGGRLRAWRTSSFSLSCCSRMAEAERPPTAVPLVLTPMRLAHSSCMPIASAHSS